MRKFALFDFYLLRAPKLPMCIVSELNAQFSSEQIESYLRQLYSEESAMEALFLASSDLFAEVMKWRLNHTEIKEKLLKTLYKYTIRMASRATPYGLFAGISPGRIVETSNESICLNNSFDAIFRLDMQCLVELSAIIATDSEIKTKLKYTTNSSLYQQGDHYKFYQQRYNKGKRSHFLTSIKASNPVKFILESTIHGVAYSTLIEKLIAKGAKQVQAERFINQLIDNKLLISELEPNLTGRDFFKTLLETVCSVDTENRFLPSLKKIELLLKECSSIIDRTRKISETLKKIAPQIQCKNLIQSDLLLSTDRNCLDKTSLEIIAKQLQDLLPLNTGESPLDLKNFKEQFLKRYEGQEIPFLEALDPDTGLGYGPAPTDYRKQDDLLHKLDLPNLKLNKVVGYPFYQELLMKKYLEAIETGSYQISLSEKDIINLQTLKSNDTELPITCYAVGNLLKKNVDSPAKKEFSFHLHGFVGASAITLMSRFGHLSEELSTQMQIVSNIEQEAYPDAIVAEIIHLPENRTGNILQRPSSRLYEIPLLIRSSDAAYPIYLSDLLISVKNERVILHSKTLQKEIIPRLTTAHNYCGGINIYRFLADLQYQDNRLRIKWDWGNLNNQPFLPRVSYKDIILSRAKWNIACGGSAYKKFDETDTDAIHEFLKRHKLPQKVVLADGDNELLINFSNPMAVRIFFDRFSKEKVTLYEFIFSEYRSPVEDIHGNQYANEIVIPFKTNNSYQFNSLPQLPSEMVRSFPPGSDWVYVKIFCGPQYAEQLMRDHVALLISQLKLKNLLDKWFFIRYNEHGHHIRLRILKNTMREAGEIVQVIYEVLSPLISSNIISNYQFDTYVREIERYTSACMEVSESLFFADSEFVLEMLKTNLTSDQRRFLAVYGIDQLLDTAGLSLEEKLVFSEELRIAYFNEFQGNKEVDHQLNQEFRDRKHHMERILCKPKLLEHTHPAIKQRYIALKDIFSGTQLATKKERFNSLLSSYCHLYINRLYITDQRLHELVTYHFLSKCYRMQLGKKRARLVITP